MGWLEKTLTHAWCWKIQNGCTTTLTVITLHWPVPAVAPEPPTGPVYFSHIEATSVVLEWRSPRDDGGAPVINYRIEVSQTQDTWTEVTIVDGDVTKIKAKDLTTDKKHYFRVFAINKAGTSKPLVSDAVTPKRAVGMCASVFSGFVLCVCVCVCVCVCACIDSMKVFCMYIKSKSMISEGVVSMCASISACVLQFLCVCVCVCVCVCGHCDGLVHRQ